MIRWLLRLAVLPAVIVLPVIEWSGIYLLHFSEMLCRLIAGTIFSPVVIGFITGIGIKLQLIKCLQLGLGFSLFHSVRKSLSTVLTSHVLT